MEKDHQVEQGQHQRERPLLNRVITSLGGNPSEWTAGDRRLVSLAFVIGLAIPIIVVCGYVFELQWTGLTEPKQRTFWDWLDLLIVPAVLALGGYLFTRSENRRAQDIADQQRAVDRELAEQRTKEDRKIADQRRQDDALQAYLDRIGNLLFDKDTPSGPHGAPPGVRTLARAHTLTILRRLDPGRKRSVLDFLYEADLIKTHQCIINLGSPDLMYSAADLSRANLRGAFLKSACLSGHFAGANLSGADLTGADLTGADLSKATLKDADLSRATLDYANLSGADLTGASGVDEGLLEQLGPSLAGATMPNGQKYEDWLKDRKGRGKDGKNSGPS